MVIGRSGILAKKQLHVVKQYSDDFEIVTNEFGIIEYHPKLIEAVSYMPDGSICGKVSNGFGYLIDYSVSGNLMSLETFGYATNYFILFDDSLKDEIRQLDIRQDGEMEPLLQVVNFRESDYRHILSVREKGGNNICRALDGWGY